MSVAQFIDFKRTERPKPRSDFIPPRRKTGANKKTYLEAEKMRDEFVDTALIAAEWAFISPNSEQISAFHNLRTPPRHPESSNGEPGSRARPSTQSLWALFKLWQKQPNHHFYTECTFTMDGNKSPHTSIRAKQRDDRTVTLSILNCLSSSYLINLYRPS